MEVLPCSGVQYAGESDCPQQSSGKSFGCDKESKGIENGKQVQQVECRMDNIMLDVERPHVRRHNGVQTIVGKLPTLEGNEDSHDSEAELQNLFCDSHAYEDNANVQNNGKDTCMGFENRNIIVDTIESELTNNSREGESSPLDSTWLEGDESVAVWVKWRGKWQAGIRCARADWPLSTLRAKPTHDRKKYFVIFFPHTRNYSWADTLLVRSINEYPQPIAYKTHKIGLKMLNDLTVARRFIMQKLAVSMLNIVDQFHTEALTEIARDVSVWKEFAMEASRCSGYSDLGRMLLKLQNMILQRYLKADWLSNSFPSWVELCQNANSAEVIETLKEELSDSILWNDVSSLRDAPGQPTLGSEWKTWKHEVMKWFSTSHPVASVGDLQQLGIDGSSNTSLQVSRKRPKLEVRRAEAHSSQVESQGSDRAIPVEIDSGFFSNRDSTNADRLASQTGKEEDSKEVTVSRHSSDFITDKWNGIIVETNGGVMQTKDVALTPVNEVAVTKLLDSGNKSRQCIAYIESKGRQCVRWANDGDVYCCVHLSSRFIGNTPRSEGAVSNDTPMCGGTTVLGNRCKHRSLQGFTFCKKHIPKNEMYCASNSSDYALKRKYEDNISSLETTNGKEIVLAGDFGTPLQVDPLSVMKGDVLQGNSNLVYKPEHPAKDCDSTELLHCIGSCLRENMSPCLESPRRFSLYCEKHLPIWLKRARNGKSRIVSKEVFVDLLSGCHSREEKFHLHQACELFHRLFKSALSLRNPVPKEVQFEWALSEASKNVSTGVFFLKLVSSEKDRLRRIWGFTAEETKTPFTVPEEPAQLPLLVYGNHDIDKAIRCKLCAYEFLDDQALGNHWMDNHKKEAQWMFRGYACAICLDSFTNKKILETHVQERHHVEFVKQCMLLQCIPCGSHFGNSEQLWLHVLSVHHVDFRLSSAVQCTMSIGDKSPKKLELFHSTSMENVTENMSDFQKFVCKFCGLKFNLLPDLGRHHQAAHMEPSLVSSQPAKRGLRYYAYRLKSGRLSRPGFKKGLMTASYKIRNKANAAIKKRIQAAKSFNTGKIRLPSVTESASLGRVAESQCSTVAKILFSKAQKTKPHPNSLDILSVARSTCCRISLKASLEQKYGVLPERFYLKAAKLCSEHNIQVDWHQDGFVCSRGCKSFKDPYLLSPLKTLPNGFKDCISACSSYPKDDNWEMDECHYIIGSHPLRQTSSQNGTVLCGDISFGLEAIPVACIVDNGILNSDPILVGDPEDQNSRHNTPWGSFTYSTKPLLHHSLTLDTESSQFGCSCSHQTCCPETCDHVYLFDNDYNDAKDIYGKPMSGRFPYDHMGRIILEEGYLVYECNKLCSCSRNCPNKVLQNGVRVKLEIFRTEKKGWAVRAGQAIMRGTFVCEYIGEVLDEQEADDRRKRYGEDGCSYLYEVDEHINDMSRMIEGQARYAIDATKYGNVSRFINHSCAPNLTSYQVLIESMECEHAHIGLYANRHIVLGEELTYDYRYKLLLGEGHPCHCGASTCRGRLY